MATRRRPWLARNVLLLGLVSLLTDTASEAILPLLPTFLTVTLGAGVLALGWIEGLAEATSSLLKLAVGRWSDRVDRRKPFVLAGYALANGVRPLMAAAMAPWHVLAVRVTDRAGKGVRTSPRDALIARSVPAGARGAAYGLHRGMDHAGAVLGPLLATAYLTFVSDALRPLFWATAVPGAIAVLVVFAGVREVAVDGPETPRAPLDPLAAPPAEDDPPDHLARFLLPLALFTLGNSSDVFLLLRASGAGAAVVTLPMLWMGIHVVKMTGSLPGGWLADQVGPRRVIAAGWLLYAAIYAGFAFAESRAAVYGLFLAYGLFHALTEGAERALVADLVPAGARGAAFGWYHVTLGLLTLAASVIFGAIWQAAGRAPAFLTSAGLALLATAALGLLAPRR